MHIDFIEHLITNVISDHVEIHRIINYEGVTNDFISKKNEKKKHGKIIFWFVSYFTCKFIIMALINAVLNSDVSFTAVPHYTSAVYNF